MIGIIIVNYKTIDETVDYIQRELCKITVPHKIVVVNVSCDDHTNYSLTERLNACFVESIETRIDQTASIYVLADMENIGYAKGNNLGAEFLFKNFDNVTHLLISNNDIEIIHGDVVERMIEIGNSDKNIAVVGPRNIELNGKNNGPHPRRSIYAAYLLSGLFGPFYTLFWRVVEKIRGYTSSDVSHHTYWVPGSFFLIKAQAFQDINGFDPATFLYAEEMILSERLRKKNYSVYYLADRSILHFHGGTVSQYSNWGQTTWRNFWSDMYYYKTYRNASHFDIAFAWVGHAMKVYIWIPMIHFGKVLVARIVTRT